MAEGTVCEFSPVAQACGILGQDPAHRSEAAPPRDDSAPAPKRLANQLTGVLLITLITTTTIAVAITGVHLQREHERLMESSLATAGTNIKTLMEDILALGLPIGALDGIDKELAKTLKADSRVVYANVVDHNAKILYSFPALTEERFFYKESVVPLMKQGEPAMFKTSSSYNSFTPVRDPKDGRVVGAVNVGVLKNTILQKTIETLLTVVVTFIAFIAVTSLLVRAFMTRAITPLEVLTRGAMSLARGELASRVSFTENNEIGSLAKSFNFMASHLEQDRKRLLSNNAELEGGNRELRRAHEEILEREQKLKNAQTQLILSEKMASLGLLIAGIAHEINTPAGAIANVASDLSGRARLVAEHLPRVAELSGDDEALLTSLLQLFIQGARASTSAADWREGRELCKWLAESGVEDAKQTGDMLMKHNLASRDQIGPYVTLLQKPWVVTLADSLGTIHVGMEICVSSIEKISRIIKALKYYAYTDMDKTSVVDINENIDNAMLLMNNKLKYTIRVAKNFSALPRIHCTSELSQVWTNMINNAHDAIMETHPAQGGGEITITTAVAGQWISVEIHDNGVGIAPEKLTDIFDPFFTTKDIGKGTGLGLSIVSGIIKKHDGKVEVESSPGSTTFRVLLPITRTKEGDHHGA